MSKLSDFDRRIRIGQQAAEWWARLQDPDMPDDDKRQFLQWLKQAPTHVAEVLVVAGIEGDLHFAARKGVLIGPIRTTDGETSKRSVEQPDQSSKAAALERLVVYNAWSLVESATDRDLALWAEDGLPVKVRIELASKPVLELPEEATLKFMAKYERQRRSKWVERIWWLVGIVLAGVLSPIAVEAVKRFLRSS